MRSRALAAALIAALAVGCSAEEPVQADPDARAGCEVPDPEAVFGADLLATPDLDGDGREEVLAKTGQETGGGFRLEDCRLVPIRFAGIERVWEFALGPGALLTCRPGGVVEEAVTAGPETVRRAWRFTGRDMVGADPSGSGSVQEPGISCE